VRCFRRRDDDCINLNSSNFKLHLSRFTIVRAVQKPAADLGRSRERYLAIINYDFGLLHAGLLQNLLVNLLISLAVAMVLALLLWLLLARTFLARFAELAQTDALTQLMNRGLFMELAKDVLAEAEERNAELVFVILDIDHFKRINDTYGHGCGDDALRHVAEIFRAVSRREDLICRFGGEEFAMLLTSSRESAARALERLRLQLGMNALEHGIHRLTIQASMGAVATRDCGYNLDYLYSSADQALYSAKRAGRNRVAWSEGRVLSRLAS
jgi:diguanylate cyclase (GGDEF)-like protein